MTLSRLLLSVALLVSSLAQANVGISSSAVAGQNQMIIKPTPGHGGGRGDDYGPVRPGPQYPDYGGSARTTEEIYVGRYLRNETLSLIHEVSHLRGYRVEAVQVYVQRSREVNASLELLVNNRSEDSTRVDIGRANSLQPRSLLEIGRHLNNLAVYVRGEMLIDRIVIQLSSEGHRPPPYEPPYDGGREIAVTLNLPSYLPPQPRLDLTPYVDVYRYRGYTVRAVELTAVARSGSATLEVLLNGFAEGRMSLSRYQSTQTFRSRQNLVIGSNFGNLVLVPRGDSNITQVRLILSR